MKDNSTIRQAFERMKYHRYAAIPIINDDGRYVGTLTEDDLLLKIKNTPGLTFRNIGRTPLSEIERHTKNTPVSINAQMEDLVARAAEQDFIPVIDDSGIFIGIIRRCEFIRYCDCVDHLNSPTTTSITSTNYFGFSYERKRMTTFRGLLRVSGTRLEQSKRGNLPHQVC
jgi:CBS-domain-containing membrane protein